MISRTQKMQIGSGFLFAIMFLFGVQSVHAYDEGFNPASGTSGSTTLKYTGAAVTNAIYHIDGSFWSQIGDPPCNANYAALTFGCQLGEEPYGQVHSLQWDDGSYPGDGTPYETAIATADHDWMYDFGSEPDNTPTSTIEQTQQNIFNGILLFFLSFSLIAFFFKPR